MKRGIWVTCFCGVLLIAMTAWAGDQPTNFGGTWILDKSERTMSPMAGGGGGYPGGGAGGSPGGGGGYPGGGVPGGGAGGGFPGGGGGGYPRGGGGGFPGGGGRRAGTGGGSTPDAGAYPEEGDLALTISQSPAELKMERRRGGDSKEEPITQVFTLDGKENTNPDDRGRSEFTSTAKWNKKSIVIEGTQPASVGGRELQMKFKEELSLSKDGQTLTIKTSRMTPRGTLTIKQTFKKAA